MIKVKSQVEFVEVTVFSDTAGYAALTVKRDPDNPERVKIRLAQGNDRYVAAMSITPRELKEFGSHLAAMGAGIVEGEE